MRLEKDKAGTFAGSRPRSTKNLHIDALDAQETLGHRQKWYVNKSDTQPLRSNLRIVGASDYMLMQSQSISEIGGQ
jgi:hypothetical protein